MLKAKLMQTFVGKGKMYAYMYIEYMVSTVVCMVSMY